MIESKWRAAMASPVSSFPSLCFWLSATPMRIVFGARSLSAGASPEAAEVAAASTAAAPSQVQDRLIFLLLLRSSSHAEP